MKGLAIRYCGCSLSVFMLFSGLCLRGESQFSAEINGVLKLAQYHQGNWKTNSYVVDVMLTPPSWQIRIEGDETHQQTFFNGTNVTWVASYPQIPKDGPLNTSMLKVFPGDRPVGVRIEEHIWMALLSRSLFAGNAHFPMKDVGLCINGTGVFTEADLSQTGLSPKLTRWHNQQSETSTNITRVEGEFAWKASTNVGGVEIPTRSELQMILKSPSSETIPSSWSEFSIGYIASTTNKSPLAPTLEGRSVVYDYRRGDLSLRRPLAYDITDGKLPSLNSGRLIELEKIQKTRAPGGKRNILIWVALALLTGAFFIPTLLRGKTNKQQTKKQ